MIDTLVIDLIGAVALLIWGVRMVRTGVSRAFGARIGHWLTVGTRNRSSSFLIGLLATCALQSSMATTLMTTAFAARELIAIPMGLAILLGADVGTALVAQLLTFNMHWLSPLLVTLGVAVFLKGKTSIRKAIGRAVLGLGLLLLSLKLLVHATEPIREASTLAALLGAATPLSAFVVASILTLLTSSSLAVILLVVALTAQGAVPLGISVALVLGANLGGSILPLIATASEPPYARRVPLGNLLMRGTACSAALPFAGHIATAVAAADPARVVVDAHLAFNAVLAIICLPMVGPLALLLERLLPAEKVNAAGLRYITPETLDNPPVALACAAREALHLNDKVQAMLESCVYALRTNDLDACATIGAIDDEADKLFNAITLFLAELKRTHALNGESLRRVSEIEAYVINLEHVGDIIDGSLSGLVARKIRRQLLFSTEGLAEIEAIATTALDSFRLALGVFMSGDVGLAHQLVERKIDVRNAEHQSTVNHLNRIKAGRPESLRTSAVHLDMLRDLKRITAHITSVAYPVLEARGVLRESRVVLTAALDG